MLAGYARQKSKPNLSISFKNLPTWFSIRQYLMFMDIHMPPKSWKLGEMPY